jgi:DNA-binding NarL/FixJ family response regulator
MIRLLCVDDHPLVREGIGLLISREPDMELIGSVATGEEAIEFFRRNKPDVTLMDLQLATISGAETIKIIKKLDPDAKVVVLTMYDGEEHVYRAMSAGANTYVLKDTISANLVRVIRQVFSGEHPLPENVQAVLNSRASHPTLTPRETEIMHLVAEGKRNKEIAGALSISEETVITHLKNIFSKLNVSDRTAALSVAIRRGIVNFHQ